jgi:hypothetical protein
MSCSDISSLRQQCLLRRRHFRTVVAAREQMAVAIGRSSESRTN